MTLRTVLLPLLLLGSAIAQDSAPRVTPEKVRSEKVPFCDGIVNGIPNARCTTPPRLAYSAGPNYPKRQGKARLPGTVELALVAGPDGLPRDITVVSSLASDFDEEAIDSVTKWKFRPATLDGKPVATKINVEVTFSALP